MGPARISKIDSSTSWHATTRAFQRMVFNHDGVWFVFVNVTKITQRCWWMNGQTEQMFYMQPCIFEECSKPLSTF